MRIPLKTCFGIFFGLIFSSVTAWGQQAEIELIETGEEPGSYFQIQRAAKPVEGGAASASGFLLTPNHAFFRRGSLRLGGEVKLTEQDDLNKGRAFTFIHQWDEGDTAEWGIWLEETGRLEIAVAVTELSPPFSFSIDLDGQKQLLEQTRTLIEEGSATKLSASFNVQRKGFHRLGLNCVSGKSLSAVSVGSIRLSGPATDNAGVVRLRWRPSAAHARFSSSKQQGTIRLWVMEMDARPGEFDFYSPITTPFGYFGPTWKRDGTIGDGLNFSLWSYSRGKEEPPIEKLSHLLAVGNPKAQFSGYGHEGTGVKIRGWSPLAGRPEQSQVIAMRMEVGDVYNTYTSYVYDRVQQKWQLFGVGNKLSNTDNLTLGSFVEVPGPPDRQRTGPYERRMRYRGWIMNDEGQWFSLDRMSYGDVDRATKLTGTERGISEQGWFYLQTGGWKLRESPASGFVSNTRATKREDVSYLKPNDIKRLTSLPSGIVANGITRRGEQASVSFSVKNVGDAAKVTIFWGDDEALTLADRWDHSQVLSQEVREDGNEFLLKRVSPDKPLLVRMLLENAYGRFWTSQTIQVR